jgi:3-oxoacyl-[acyl-carrier protein] reductase
MKNNKSKLLLFGGSGSIGSEVTSFFRKKGWDVYIVSRKESSDPFYLQWDPCSHKNEPKVIENLKLIGSIDAVCWTQGMNLNDSIYDFDLSSHEQMYRVNVVYILNSLKLLLDVGVLNKPTRFCIVSSIWQSISRQNKLSYSVTKSALQGLVLSACNDLARDGHLINAVLPGALETPMTRANLSEDQIKSFESATQFGRLAEIGDVANAVYTLCSEINTGVTGNFVTVDLGYSHVRNF